MKVKLDISGIGAGISAILSLVAIILFAAGYNASLGYFSVQFAGLPYVVGFGVTNIILAAAVVVLPMLKVGGTAKKVIDLAVDILTVALCVFFCLMLVYAAKSSVYEMALTWGSDLHSNETYMIGACTNALVSMIICLVAMLLVGVSACITKTIYVKKDAA